MSEEQPGLSFDERMSDADALMWTIERDPALRSTITMVSILEASPDHARLKQRYERASRVIPRLRQRVEEATRLAPPRWEIDPNFDLDYHLRFTRAAGDGSLREVLDMAEPMAMQSFDRVRPLWECVVVEGLEDGRCAIVTKLHHAITDGVGGVRLQLELFDLEQDAAERVMPEPPEPNHWNQRDRIRDAARHELRRQLGIVRRNAPKVLSRASDVYRDPVTSAEAAAGVAGSAARLLRPAATPLSPVMTGRSLSVRFDTITVPLKPAKAAAREMGGKLNDFFMGGIARGMRAYHEKHGESVPELRISMPMSLRGPGQEHVVGNAFVPARFRLPLYHDSPADTVWSLRELVSEIRNEPALDLVEPLANLINRLPPPAVTAMFGTLMKGMDLTASNVPGPPIPLYLAGVPMLAQFPFGPLAGAALNVTLLSYVDDLDIGVVSDPSAVEDPDVLIDCLEEGFAQILSLRS